jgi:cell division protein FtsI (penicillin-binding protein 3)
MVNQPSFNPNNRAQRDPALYRNRAATDPFEPGSSFKPFVFAAALESGRVTPDTLIDTSPGYLNVGGRLLTKDASNLGRIDVATILAKSSSVGAAQIALQTEGQDIWRVLSGFGIGRSTESGFPGESAGVLTDSRHWRSVGQATLSYGYGLSVTTLQLARAYAAIASGGIARPVSLEALDRAPNGDRVISKLTAAQLIAMMEGVVSPAGTGQRAAVKNFSVAGKTGTAWISGVGGYSGDRYTAVFGGIAPASDPRLVAVVVIDDPKGQAYYGGDIAAPVFSRIVAGALRVLAVAPDALSDPPLTVVAQAQVGP